MVLRYLFAVFIYLYSFQRLVFHTTRKIRGWLSFSELVSLLQLAEQSCFFSSSWFSFQVQVIKFSCNTTLHNKINKNIRTANSPRNYQKKPWTTRPQAVTSPVCVWNTMKVRTYGSVGTAAILLCIINKIENISEHLVQETTKKPWAKRLNLKRCPLQNVYEGQNLWQCRQYLLLSPDLCGLTPLAPYSTASSGRDHRPAWGRSHYHYHYHYSPPFLAKTDPHWLPARWMSGKYPGATK